ncbi:MAG: AAA family ATPase, partial [Candidatus Heimdallarchaeota archaeon]|nr:AAA family ATPase [Candidatus Heimdallarchaeota archaeon]MCK4609609.1 AAA family ATPase [Candidatus Heimdallarchaeota archaeon]
MKIHCLEIENYRQYRGKNKIDFTLDDEMNFTVILGVNGAGKTNILNAITWCLYGEEAHLLKYRDKMGKINESALAEMNDGDTLKACVRISFGTDTPIFIFEREIVAQKNNGSIIISEKIPKA